MREREAKNNKKKRNKEFSDCRNSNKTNTIGIVLSSIGSIVHYTFPF